MKTGYTLAVALLIAVAVGFGMYMIDVEQTQEARLPDVDVTVQGGQMPKFNADVGKITVTEESITVPSVEVTPPEQTANN